MANVSAMLTASRGPHPAGDLRAALARPAGRRAARRGAPGQQAAVSQHLRVLKDVGLVFDRQAGTRALPGRSRRARAAAGPPGRVLGALVGRLRPPNRGSKQHGHDRGRHPARGCRRRRPAAAFEIFTADMTSWWPRPTTSARRRSRRSSSSRGSAGAGSPATRTARRRTPAWSPRGSRPAVRRHVADRRRLEVPHRPGHVGRRALRARGPGPHAGRPRTQRPRGVRRSCGCDAQDLRGRGAWTATLGAYAAARPRRPDEVRRPVHLPADDVVHRASPPHFRRPQGADSTRSHARGDLLMVGTFGNAQTQGSMAIFRTRRPPRSSSAAIPSWRTAS